MPDSKTCQQCGEYNSGSAAFCAVCGARLSGEKEARRVGDSTYERGDPTLVTSQGYLSPGAWATALLVLSIPIVGVIASLYWAFWDTQHEDRTNFCRGALWLGTSVLAVYFFCRGAWWLGAILSAVNFALARITFVERG